MQSPKAPYDMTVTQRSHLSPKYHAIQHRAVHVIICLLQNDKSCCEAITVFIKLPRTDFLHQCFMPRKGCAKQAFKVCSTFLASTLSEQNAQSLHHGRTLRSHNGPGGSGVLSRL